MKSLGHYTSGLDVMWGTLKNCVGRDHGRPLHTSSVKPGCFRNKV